VNLQVVLLCWRNTLQDDKFNWTKDHIGSRVVCTGRNGESKFGTLNDVVTISNSSKFLDVKIDGSAKERNYVPEDVVVLVPDEVEQALKE
jgi:hypothetical protein